MYETTPCSAQPYSKPHEDEMIKVPEERISYKRQAVQHQMPPSHQIIVMKDVIYYTIKVHHALLASDRKEHMSTSLYCQCFSLSVLV